MQLTQQTKDGLTEAMGIALNQVGTGADQIKEILKNAGKDGSAKLVAAMAQAKISGTLSTEAQAGMESFLKGFSGLDEKLKRRGHRRGMELWKDWKGLKRWLIRQSKVRMHSCKA